MLTRSEFEELYNNKDFNTINAEYANGSKEEQAILLNWLNETKSAEEAFADIGETLREVEKAEEAELENTISEARAATQFRQDLSPEERQRQANTLRAKRANLKRRISKKFRLYLPFTARQAAEAINANPQIVENYLRGEAAVPGREIVSVEGGLYMLIDLFA